MDYNQNNYNNLPQKQPGDGAATGCLVCGIISIFICGLILGIVGLVLGSNAKKQGYVGGKLTAGIVCSIIGLVGWGILVACSVCSICAAGSAGLLGY